MWPRLGALRCATIACPSVAEAVAMYGQGLGHAVVERGAVSVALAQRWNANAIAGADYAVLGPTSGAASYLRFIEDPGAVPATPYTTLGWAALEFSVRSSDAAVARLEAHGFRVLGAAQDLAFANGALRAGQVGGPNGDVLYLTQINAPLPNYDLPMASADVDRLFIVVQGVPNVAQACRWHAEVTGAQPKDTFDAAVPFIAGFLGLPATHPFHIGCVQTVPGSYIELDELPRTVGPRPCRAGHLPAGIAMVSFAVAGAWAADDVAAIGPAPRESAGVVYGGGRSVTVHGPHGEWIELIESNEAG